jgi:hypothetical protein
MLCWYFHFMLFTYGRSMFRKHSDIDIWYVYDGRHDGPQPYFYKIRYPQIFTFTWPCILINFLVIKRNICTNFSNLFWKRHSTCFWQFLCPSSAIIHCILSSGVCRTDNFRPGGSERNCSILNLLHESCLQTCMTYTIAVCTVNNSWWWTEELSETCRVSFPK